MNPLIRHAVFMAALYACITAIGAVYPVSAKAAPVNSALDRIIEQELARQEIVGAAVGVIQNGKVIHVKGYGHQSLARKRRITRETVFRWASISKTVTAVAAFQLIEQKKLKLGDKASKMCAYWPRTGEESAVTLGHLLTNRSGLHQYGRDHKKKKRFHFDSSKYANHQGRFSGQAAVGTFEHKVSFKPGSQYRYSSFGFNLAGAMIDETAPKGYEMWVLDRIAKPLGMKSMTAHASALGGYTKDCNGRLTPIKEESVDWKLPGGGWSSNISDLTRFMGGLMGKTLLNKPHALWSKTPNQTTPKKKKKGKRPTADENPYRYGVLSSGTGDTRVVHHGGSHKDTRTLMHFYPKKKTGVVIYANGDKSYVNLERILNAVLWQLKIGKGTLKPYHAQLKKKCGDPYFGVWNKTESKNGQQEPTGVIYRRAYTTGQFHTEWKHLRALGYQVLDIEPFYKNKQLFWDGVFKKQKGATALLRNLSRDEFHKEWSSLKKKGYQLIDIETYRLDRSRKWAGAFIKRRVKQALKRNITTKELVDIQRQMEKKGFRIIDIESYAEGAKRLWAAVWVADGRGIVTVNLSKDEFWTLVQTRSKKKYRLIDVERYPSGQSHLYAGVWEKVAYPTTASQKVSKGQKFGDFSRSHGSHDINKFELFDLERF